MIRTRNPRIDVADVERAIAEELAHAAGNRPDDRLVRLAASVHARAIAAQLDRAEERSQPRTHWPSDLRAPSFVSPALRRLVLRVLSLAFRDQHHVNASLIRAQRETLALVETLIERIDVLESILESERSSARELRMRGARSSRPE